MMPAVLVPMTSCRTAAAPKRAGRRLPRPSEEAVLVHGKFRQTVVAALSKRLQGLGQSLRIGRRRPRRSWVSMFTVSNSQRLRPLRRSARGRQRRRHTPPDASWVAVYSGEQQRLSLLSRQRPSAA